MTRGIKNVILGKNRLVLIQNLLKMSVMVITIFICYRKNFDVVKTTCIAIIVFLLLAWLDIIFTKIIDRTLEKMYAKMIKEESQEIVEFFVYGIVRKRCHILPVLKTFDEMIDDDE